MNSAQSFKTIIIDDFHPVLLEKLEQQNIQFHYLPDISKEEAIRALANYEIAIVRSKLEFTSELISTLPNLKCIARGGAGMDNINEAAALAGGITLLNAPEGNRDAVAEHAIGLMLSISNRIVIASQQVKDRIWKREENRGWEIGGKTLGIIGYGNTGQALARKLSGFGCRCIAFDKYFPAHAGIAEAADLSTLLSSSDIVSLHIPLTDETRGMVNNDFISKMKKGAVLINTSRGAIVKQADVLQALKNNHLSAFATDVLENENFRSYDYQESELFRELSEMPQVIITPHVAGWTKESYLKIAEVLADKVIDFTTK